METDRKCEGDCGEHRGTVRLVRVNDPQYKGWGLWWYCDEAIREDRENEFTVAEVADDNK